MPYMLLSLRTCNCASQGKKTGKRDNEGKEKMEEEGNKEEKETEKWKLKKEG
jgi:hypothetical protein